MLAIPWGLAEILYPAYGHDQSLERLAERGGFGRGELGQSAASGPTAAADCSSGGRSSTYTTWPGAEWMTSNDGVLQQPVARHILRICRGIVQLRTYRSI